MAMDVVDDDIKGRAAASPSGGGCSMPQTGAHTQAIAARGLLPERGRLPAPREVAARYSADGEHTRAAALGRSEQGASPSGGGCGMPQTGAHL